MRTLRRAGKPTGYILVQTLVVLSAVTALLAIMSADQHAAMQQTQIRLDERRAEQAANAGIARAMATLQSANANLVMLSDSWAAVGQNGVTPSNTTPVTPDEYQLNPANGDDPSAPTFRMQIVDAGSLINLNAAAYASSLPAAQQTTAIANVTQQLLALGLSQQQADCLLDWEQTSTQPRSDGAKDEFYNTLPVPYNTELGPMNTVNEALLVDNWTGETLYQPPQAQQNSSASLPVDVSGNVLPIASLVTVDSGSPNTQASGAARINVTTNTNSLTTTFGFSQQQAQQAGQARTFQQLLSIPGVQMNRAQTMLNEATFTNSRWTGKINLNTASQAVLLTVPGMTQSMASAIVSQQGSGGYTTLGQLTTVPGMTMPLLAQLADEFTVGSDTWIVRVYGHSGNVGVAVEAVIGIRNSQPQVITYERINTATVPSWWDWQASMATIDAAQNT